jgi:phosphatidylinositol alpha-1,6-mannosyltransferase
MERRPINVLLLTWDFPPAKGGIQIWMYELARRLPDATVTVLAPAVPGSAEFDSTLGIELHRLGGTRWGPAWWGLRLVIGVIRVVCTKRPDVIVCGHVVTGPAGFMAHLFLRVPYVVFNYGSEIRRRRRKSLVNLVITQASAIIAISHFTRASLVARGIPPGRIRILYPGVDPDRFTPGDRDEARAGLAGSKKLLTVSRLNELYKGHDTVIRALPLMLARIPEIEYLIVGSGPHQRYLQQLAVSLDVDAHVAFLGDVPDENLPEVYRQSDVVLQVSREARSGGGAEGFGIVCLEAGASGKPVVAGRSGGLPDAVLDGVTGVLIDPTDIAVVAETVVGLLKDPERARLFGEQGRARAVRDFTWDAMARKAYRLFAEAAGYVPSSADVYA